MAGHRCCCGCCHVRTGTLAIASLGLFANALNLYSYATTCCTSLSYVVLAMTLANLVADVCAIYGVLNRRPQLLKILLIVYISGLVVAVIELCVIVVMMSGGLASVRAEYKAIFKHSIQSSNKHMTEQELDTFLNAMMNSLLVASLLSIIISSWLTSVVYACYKWLLESNAEAAQYGVGYSMQPAVVQKY